MPDTAWVLRELCLMNRCMFIEVDEYSWSWEHCWVVGNSLSTEVLTRKRCELQPGWWALRALEQKQGGCLGKMALRATREGDRRWEPEGGRGHIGKPLHSKPRGWLWPYSIWFSNASCRTSRDMRRDMCHILERPQNHWMNTVHLPGGLINFLGFIIFNYKICSLADG